MFISILFQLDVISRTVTILEQRLTLTEDRVANIMAFTRDLAANQQLIHRQQQLSQGNSSDSSRQPPLPIPPPPQTKIQPQAQTQSTSSNVNSHLVTSIHNIASIASVNASSASVDSGSSDGLNQTAKSSSVAHPSLGATDFDPIYDEASELLDPDDDDKGRDNDDEPLEAGEFDADSGESVGDNGTEYTDDFSAQLDENGP